LGRTVFSSKLSKIYIILKSFLAWLGVGLGSNRKSNGFGSSILWEDEVDRVFAPSAGTTT
jgi:hypothetical protein